MLILLDVEFSSSSLRTHTCHAIFPARQNGLFFCIDFVKVDFWGRWETLEEMSVTA